MSEEQAAIQQIRAQFPFPWNQVMFHNGEIKLIDATGHEVGIFSIVGLCTHITAHIASKATV